MLGSSLLHTAGTATCQRKAKNRPAGKDCKCVTFKAKTKNPVYVWRCPSRKLKAHNKKQCRMGAKVIKSAVHVNRHGRSYKLVPSFRRKQFVKCK